jgi:hypothetical protein
MVRIGLGVLRSLFRGQTVKFIILYKVFLMKSKLLYKKIIYHKLEPGECSIFHFTNFRNATKQKFYIFGDWK